MKTLESLHAELSKLREQFSQYEKQAKFAQWNMDAVSHRGRLVLEQIQKLEKEQVNGT